MGWNMKVSPFQISRTLGQKQTRKLIDGYLDRRVKIENEMMKQAVSDYMYHLFMRQSTSDLGLQILFSKGIQSNLPLGTEDKFGDPNFPIPVSIVMGANDWVRKCDDDYGRICIEGRK